MEVFVGNLPFDITEQEILDSFAKFGAVSGVKMLTDKITGKFRGIAFVTMDDEAQANAAIEALNNMEMGGRPMRVDKSRERPERRFNGFGGGFRENRPSGFGGAPRENRQGGFGGGRPSFRRRFNDDGQGGDNRGDFNGGGNRDNGGFRGRGEGFEQRREGGFRGNGGGFKRRFNDNGGRRNFNDNAPRRGFDDNGGDNNGFRPRQRFDNDSSFGD